MKPQKCPLRTFSTSIAVTPVDNELDRSFLHELRAHVHVLVSACTHMHLDQREFACVHTHKWKRSFLRAFASVRLRACSHTGLIKTQNAFTRKNRKTQTHFGFRNCQDVHYSTLPSTVGTYQLYFSMCTCGNSNCFTNSRTHTRTHTHI